MLMALLLRLLLPAVGVRFVAVSMEVVGVIGRVTAWQGVVDSDSRKM